MSDPVRALVAKWRARANEVLAEAARESTVGGMSGDYVGPTLEDCADELEAALNATVVSFDE